MLRVVGVEVGNVDRVEAARVLDVIDMVQLDVPGERYGLSPKLLRLLGQLVVEGELGERPVGEL